MFRLRFKAAVRQNRSSSQSTACMTRLGFLSPILFAEKMAVPDIYNELQKKLVDIRDKKP